MMLPIHGWYTSKAATRTKHKKGKQPVRRPFENETVIDWTAFLTLEENKVNLDMQLSDYHSPAGKTIVFADGFSDSSNVKSSHPTLDLSTFQADCVYMHTCMILGCIHAQQAVVIVSAGDTDVIVLLFQQNVNIFG